MSDGLFEGLDRFNRCVLMQSISRDITMKIPGGLCKILHTYTKQQRFADLARSINDGRSLLRLALCIALPGRVKQALSKRESEPCFAHTAIPSADQGIATAATFISCFGFLLEALASIFDNISLYTRWVPGSPARKALSLRSGRYSHKSMGIAYCISTLVDVLTISRMYMRQLVDPVYTFHDFKIKVVTFVRHLCDALATLQSAHLAEFHFTPYTLGALNIVAGVGFCYETYQHQLAADNKSKKTAK